MLGLARLKPRLERSDWPQLTKPQHFDGTWTVAVGIWNGPLGSSGEWHIKKSGKVVPGRSTVLGPGSC